MNPSANFSILDSHAPALARLGMLAERNFADDPNTTIIKLRQFGEVMAQSTAAKLGIYMLDDDRQITLLQRLGDERGITSAILDLFHQIRKIGNQATHSLLDDSGLALTALKTAHRLAIWYHRSFGRERDFKASPFAPPLAPATADEGLTEELEELRLQLVATQSAAEQEKARADAERQKRQSAEQEKASLERLASEASDCIDQLMAELDSARAAAEPMPAADLALMTKQINAAAIGLDLDERDTRRLIDIQLRHAGWDVDSDNLTYKKGVRPQKGKNLAIAEWPTDNGPADYVLFTGLQLVAVVEAKRKNKDVSATIDQAKRYARGYQIKGDEILTPGHPWKDGNGENHYVPFVFSTNGRPYLKQLQTKSGIWFCDLRRPQNIRRALEGWYTPQGLKDLLAQDIDAAHQKLKTAGFDFGFALRDYQKKAIQATEEAIEKGQREILLAMATGTGKTKTCIALVYRLLKANRFKRILFLVDRSALGEQTGDAFDTTQMERLQKFSEIYKVHGLKNKGPKNKGQKDKGPKKSGPKNSGPKDGSIDDSTRVHIATVQSFVKRLLYTEDDSKTPAVDQYDAIVIDECHRGYLLDREMNDHEMAFRDQLDYVSKYRQVLEHFDAVKIGLTATPALHTTDIFGKPVYTYSYREAVIDGFLIDHEPPIRIKTALSQAGIEWKKGATMQVYDPATGKIDLETAPDTINYEIDKFNKKVVTEAFNKVVCETLTGVQGDIDNPIDPLDDAKTLIFCATDAHAEIVVNQMKLALKKAGHQGTDDLVAKITGAADKPDQLIRHFRNDPCPKIAVTVDLLTTGIDVPHICNLVFIRRVNSRILYDQMLGRATRLCPDIGKEFFRVFDAVALYDNLQDLTAMKPVTVNPKITFAQLVDELLQSDDVDICNDLKGQIIAKLQRSKKRYSDDTHALIEQQTDSPAEGLATILKTQDPQTVKDWFRARPTLASLLDYTGKGSPPRVLISDHGDTLVATETGYGDNEKPEDFLDGFTRFIRDNQNKIDALTIITTRPRDLTRQHLKEVRQLLEDHHFRESDLRAAWRATTNEDIAASIIGFIRQAALGDALLPYAVRVEKAVKDITAKGDWTGIQKKWLQRIGKQLMHEKNDPVIDASSLDHAAFNTEGGFKQINKFFGGKLESVLGDINEAVWRDVG